MDLKKIDRSGLSKNDHIILDYLIRNEDRVFLESSLDIANKTGVSNATIGRFWRKIGFQNIKDFRNALAKREDATPAGRIKNTLLELENENTDISQLLLKNMNNIEKTIEFLSVEDIDRAADLILSQKRIYVFAPDASQGVADIFEYRLRRLNMEFITIEGGSSIYEYLINISKDDFVMIFCFSRVLSETKILLDYCDKKQVPSVLFTDMFSQDLHRQATATLYSYRGEKKEYHSMVAPLSIIDCLVITLAIKKEDSVNHMNELNRLRSEYQSYIKR